MANRLLGSNKTLTVASPSKVFVSERRHQRGIDNGKVAFGFYN